MIIGGWLAGWGGTHDAAAAMKTTFLFAQIVAKRLLPLLACKSRRLVAVVFSYSMGYRDSAIFSTLWRTETWSRLKLWAQRSLI